MTETTPPFGLDAFDTATDAPGAGGRTRVQLFEVSTLYGAATLAAALDAGLFGPRHRVLRVLLVSNNAEVPETASRLDGMQGWHRLAARFDRVVDWNDTIRPHHPSTWTPAANDAPLWERMFRASWDLGDGPIDLVVESVHVSPAKALATIFADASVHVYADGLMSYGPTREKLPQATACRIQRLLHLDLVPGLTPLLLTEYGVPSELVPSDTFRAVLDELDDADADGAADADGGVDPDAAGAPTAVLLGQYLAALGILTVDEEEALHERMLRGAAAAGHRSVLFKPHPTAPARYSKVLDKAAADTGIRLEVLDRPMLAETVFRRYRPRLVVGCFSTAMLTASALYGVPIARVGTGPLLDRLTPYQNSNRIPLTIVDALVPDLEAPEAAERGGGEVVTEAEDAGRRIEPLVRAVGYCMQADRYPDLRAEAEAWLSARLAEGGDTVPRYFKRRRLTALGLPGGLAPKLVRRLPGGDTALRAARRVKRAAARGR
ncbi:polysialyltransferase family glycosyltransferase [Streptomyces macrosporus]|uniref:Alpha-2,8-polysialyltransferase family protein n=1 Tax=Streptomyces macrosporus TaxID=44032 RepID=A0ABP5XIQ7_9ACTN